jgi:hypothetical protein
VSARSRALAATLASLRVAWPTAAPCDDSATFAQIDVVRALAAGVVIDGQDADWSGIPALPDPAGDAAGDASRDITSVSIAPTDQALLVRIATAGTPSSGDLAFWLDVDFMGQQPLDFQLGLYLGFPDILWVYEEGQPATFQNWDGSVTAVGQVVEVRIPYALLDAVLPPAMQGRLTGASARSFVRVMPFSIDIGSGARIDDGAAVASYRLVTTPYALDPPLPSGSEDPVAVRLPLSGSWYVGQGAFGLGSHAGTWGYDLHLVDNALHPDDPHPGPQNADYPSFGQLVLAPSAGSVFSLENAQPDLPPRSFGSVPSPPNFVFLEIPGNVGLLFSHLEQGSIPVAPAQAVGAGELLGHVGHSGSTSWPHLHFGAEDIANGFATLPLAIEDAEVRLNPVSDDPWLRRVPLWGIREGFLVANAPTQVPAIAPGTSAWLAAALAACAGLALRRSARSRTGVARARTR